MNNQKMRVQNYKKSLIKMRVKRETLKKCRARKKFNRNRKDFEENLLKIFKLMRPHSKKLLLRFNITKEFKFLSVHQVPVILTEDLVEEMRSINTAIIQYKRLPYKHFFFHKIRISLSQC